MPSLVMSTPLLSIHLRATKVEIANSAQGVKMVRTARMVALVTNPGMLVAHRGTDAVAAVAGVVVAVVVAVTSVAMIVVMTVATTAGVAHRKTPKPS